MVRKIESGIESHLFYCGIVLKDPRRQTTLLLMCKPSLFTVQTKRKFKTKRIVNSSKSKDLSQFQKGKTGRFAKAIFYFLKADDKDSCTAIVQRKAVKLGDGEGMQVPCTLRFKRTEKCINVLRQELQICN